LKSDRERGRDRGRTDGSSCQFARTANQRLATREFSDWPFGGTTAKEFADALSDVEVLGSSGNSVAHPKRIPAGRRSSFPQKNGMRML
jgi:hypothetical protein